LVYQIAKKSPKAFYGFWTFKIINQKLLFFDFF
jgi:hypothetical protein